MPLVFYHEVVVAAMVMHKGGQRMQNKLRELRRKHGLPMLGVAALSKVSTSTLGAIERFDYLPSEDVRQRIAGAVGVSVEEIWPELAGRKVEDGTTFVTS
jgi:transcriptional regulator with XRE-family HTH domain